MKPRAPADMSGTLLPGIGGYVQRLEKIAQECGEKQAGEAVEKDEFLRVKQRIYALLEQCREDIHDRAALLKRRGNCHETITKGHAIRTGLDELKASLPKLQELHRKAQSKRSAARHKEELQARYKDIRVLKRHVDEVHELFASVSNATAEESPCVKASLLGLREDPVQFVPAARPEDTRRGLTADEQEALAAMKKRDAEIDKQVDQLGKVVERLDPLAKQIGVTADRHRIKAEGLTSDVEQADQDLKGLNQSIDEIMKYESNTNCCCQLTLLIVLLCCMSYVFQQLS